MENGCFDLGSSNSNPNKCWHPEPPSYPNPYGEKTKSKKKNKDSHSNTKQNKDKKKKRRNSHLDRKVDISRHKWTQL